MDIEARYINMFNRNEQSYHDKQQLTPDVSVKFSDDFAAKYLRSCYTLDFPMRVRERNKPVITTHACALGGSQRKFNKRNLPWKT